MPDEASQLDVAFVGHGAGIDDGQIGDGGIIDDNGVTVLERLAHLLGVVLVGLTPEGVEVDVHGRTVSPRRRVHTCSVRPFPRR